MKTLNVRPADGLKVRDPVRGDLIEDTGREVPASDYWIRRLRDHDVVEVEPDHKEASPAP